MSRFQWGFTLVELMVALLLAMVLITGVGSLYLSTNRTYTLQEELARVQENARTAMDLLVREIRMSAHSGCPPWVNFANALYSNDPARQWMAHVDKGISGIPAGNDTANIIDHNALSEAIALHWIDWENSVSVSSHNTTESIISVAGGHGFNQGDLLALIAPGCSQISVVIGGADTTASSVSHWAATAGSLYNCTSLIKGHFNCMDNGKGDDTFGHSDSLLAPVVSTAYYIRESNGVPTLYRRRGGETASGNRHSAEALVEGIEGLRFLYGQDTDGDGIVNQYRSASDIGLFSKGWHDVTSVKIELLARSFQDVAPEPQPYFFAGVKTTPEDQYIRRAFMATVGLRNRTK
ncbi:PilW family protein [Endozoicomonas sp. Mp262]|uniref:PilW family protein n=1 Tax=Endozoicomonas sp. Mp262 TaxID=2919499 RepID=UPI0021DA7203